jgi:preprotein translocase subunit SecE
MAKQSSKKAEGKSRSKGRVKTVLDKRKKEYHLPLPDNKLGRIFSKRVRIVPGFLRNAWAEIRQVTWPGRKETLRLTIAVFIFSIIFGSFVSALDYGIGKLFKEVILK